MKFFLNNSNYKRIAEVVDSFYFDYVDPNILEPTEHDQDDDQIKSLLFDFEESRGWPDELPPISITFDEDVDSYVILNGHHRWKAALDFGIDKVPVRVFKSDPVFVDWYLKTEEE